MVKKTSIPRKKSKKKSKKSQQKALKIHKKRQITNIVLILVLAIVIVGGAVFLTVNSAEVNDESPGFVKSLNNLNQKFLNIFRQKTDEDTSSLISTEDFEVVAVVNEQEITSKELDARYNQIPPVV